MRLLPLSALIAALALPAAALHAENAPAYVAGEKRSETMTMISHLALSPDGKRLACVWDGDIWIVPAEGGEARRLTQHPAEEGNPVWSRDGKRLAFSSKREGGVTQVFVMDVEGGEPRQVTFHTEGAVPMSWWPDGKSLLIGGARANLSQNYKPPFRLFRINLEKREREELLFDDYSGGGDVSPDGRRILITREDHEPYRIGYRGSQASQVWIYDLDTKKFTCALRGETGHRSPRWRADGQAFHYLDSESGVYNLAEYDLRRGKKKILTHHTDSNCYTPSVSADGSVAIYRCGFDLYRLDRNDDTPAPKLLTVFNRSDRERDRTVRRTLTRAAEAVFSKDGLETFFTAGGDLWVMDSGVAEPHAITKTPVEELCPKLSEDGDTLYFIRNTGDTQDLFRATREDASKFWWQNDRFTTVAITSDKVAKKKLTLSPDGKHLAYVRGLGDLVVARRDGSESKVIRSGWHAPDYSWSPDGKWIAYSVPDDDFNNDIWIMPADGSAAPVNISRHPDDDEAPAWSPDGKCLAWVHRQGENNRELSFVWLTKDRDELSARDRKIEEAVEKMKKERTAAKTKAANGDDKPAKADSEKAKESDDKPAKTTPVPVDLADIHRRVRHIPIPFSEKFSGLDWTDDSKKVLFTGKADGKDATLSLEITADSPKPETFSPSVIVGGNWLAKPKALAGLADGLPALAKSGAAATTVKFAARQEFNRDERQRAAFLDAWRFMRDTYYDPALNHRDWNAVRSRYEETAARAVDTITFDRVMNMMLGELNGSHLGYRSEKEPVRDSEWKVTTAHLGVYFDPAHNGAGLRVAGVIPDSPADRVRSRLAAGDTILTINDTEVFSKTDLTTVLNGPLDRDIRLRVRDPLGAERTVIMRPASCDEIRKLVRTDHLRRTAALTESLSGGKLGYVYVAHMDWKSFREFEKAIYAEGSGKQGLVIDVRDNPGGFTTDHLLTILCQPQHAITKPRDGGVGYPQHERRVFGAWTKPIVVLCNQNSYSNSEVFSHAVKNLGRGKLVGVPTAGGVISTGGTNVFDMGELRTPFRGWYSIHTGEDYELNGAAPDHVVWPEPGEITAGKDRQLEKAVEVLLRDVAAVKPLPKPINAHDTDRRAD